MADHPGQPADLDGQRYLVAPRGTTQWVRNLRAAGSGELQLGRRIEPFQAAELRRRRQGTDLARVPAPVEVEVGQFFDGVDAKATDEQLATVAPGFPIFQITAG